MEAAIGNADFDRERKNAGSRLNAGASDRARHAYIHVIPGRGAGAGAAYECQYPMTQTREALTRAHNQMFPLLLLFLV